MSHLDDSMAQYLEPSLGESDETDITPPRTPELRLDTDNDLTSDQVLLDHDMQNENTDTENSAPPSQPRPRDTNQQVNGRSVEVQLMRKLLAGRFVWDAKFPTEFKDTFMPFFTQESSDPAESLIVKNATALFNSACCLNLGDFQWSNLTHVTLPRSFKHFALDPDELRLLLHCYKTLYPHETIELPFLSRVARKYSNIMLGSEKFGSKMDCRNLRSVRIMASWTVSDGLIDISTARRAGIVTFYIVHNVKINEKFVQHVFAVVW